MNRPDDFDREMQGVAFWVGVFNALLVLAALGACAGLGYLFWAEFLREAGQ